MKKKLSLLFLLLAIMANAQIVNIPDANFKAKLLSSSPGNTIAKNLSGNYFAIDANGDGEVQQTEADAVGELEVSESDSTICANTNFQGISSFTQVKKIKIGYDYPIHTPQSISNLQELQEVDFTISYWYYNSLITLNISNCNKLKKYKGHAFPIFTNTLLLEDVELYIAADNSVTTLFKNTLLSVETLTNLKNLLIRNLGIEYNPIYTLNLSYHNKFESFIISCYPYNNGLTLDKVDLSHCSQLKNISIDGYVNNSDYPTVYNSTVKELDISYCANNTINGTGLKNLNLDSPFLKKLVINNAPNLEKIKLISLESLQANNCPLLNEIDTYMIGLGATSTPLEASNCPNLKKISTCYRYSSFDGTPFTALEDIIFKSYTFNSYAAYYFSPLPELQSLVLNTNANLKTLEIKNYALSNISLNGLPKLESLITSMYTSSLVNNLPISLQTLNIQNCPLLANITLEGHCGKTTTIKNCPSLTNFEIPVNYYSINRLNSLEIENCTLLNKVKTPVNDLINLKILTCPALEELDVERNLLTSFDLTGSMASIKNLNLINNNLTAFNIQPFTNLETLDLSGNKITDLDMSMHPKISLFIYINAANYTTSTLNPPIYLKTVNLNGCPNIQTVDLESSVLDKVFLKNGVNETLTVTNSPLLQYVCADDSQVATIQSSLTSQGLPNVNINTYCSFVPGGSYNTITGLVRFDENNNGCDTNDEIFEHMKLKITDGTTGETFVKNNGKYDFYTQAGNFTVTAEPENPALFNVTPATFSTSFPNNNNNVFTQDLCVTKNGNANDLEVVIAPLTNAVPGFDAKYKVMWRNKGNTILSGNVTFTFNASKMDFVSSGLPSAVSGNQITFNFTNLKPYANTASEITFNIHPPTHPTSPANAGDQLNFMASLGPVVGDINPADNTFNYQQTVINSFDPNDIVCLQGNTIPAAMIGNYLHYIVNFENSGTAPATNIVVEMDINPADFDISSLQLQNASHQAYTKVTENKAEFMMKSANLGSGGHGNILLKMKSKGTLNPGDQLMNKANIYFDYNFPIETNDAVTNIAGVLKVEENLNATSAEVYPNPTKGEVNINAESEIKAVEVYDNAGRIIQKQIGINARKTTLTIRSENKGVFYLKIIADKGSVMKKVIKN
ncbi:T9SS type A sorting domain-containing protein [Chryseobacterium profundimaris]|uniref:Conserved repeat domain-containing protein/Por secretion system C-terminal sorting domain-containing protein n=1 Tax=Chryseobacterium profundimaris TaxID=1387275 RepID=A0ABY1NJS3_9FLAO|nr:T9SS type A sorting domain-containing protein [Chryseobacterium profundimaris]SMP11579.1 conserved repeat domain-containing protein/Por secretion system C-terminal sorting domain-containing protein [Chryseobacterium profundimaris]